MKKNSIIILFLIFILVFTVWILFFKKEEKISDNQTIQNLPVISSQVMKKQGLNYIITIEKPEISSTDYSEKFNKLIEEYISDLAVDFENQLFNKKTESINELAGYYEIITLNEKIISIKFNVFQSLDYPIESVKFFNFNVLNGEEISSEYIFNKRNIESVSSYCKNILLKIFEENNLEFNQELLDIGLEPEENNFENFALIDWDRALFYFSSYQIGSDSLSPQEVEIFLLSPNEQILNSASVYCQREGGSLETRDFLNGEASYCIFLDGSECEEWKFFKGECIEGENFCRDYCGDGECQEVVCLGSGCPCSENKNNCLIDCK